MNTDNLQENYYRRLAKRLGYVLKKSRGKNWNLDNQLGYMIVNAEFNSVMQGGRFELTLDDVANFFTGTKEQATNTICP